ncbi:MAG TPA: lactate racemase domain-containing protein [Candidatus Dormibacteraeota bacterium]|nr:lactate racemase domain-containing protein [Candidatus Dormibacteraeota bacterium]
MAWCFRWMAASALSAEFEVEGLGSSDRVLREEQVREVLDKAFAEVPVDGRRLLVLLPDGTRHAPIPMLFRLLNELLGRRASRIDFLIALGTHPAMSPEAVDRLVGLPESERAALYPHASVFNHTWDQPGTLVRVGTLSGAELDEVTGGLLCEDVPVDLSRSMLDYDHLIICGPVFPHEVAGFSGGAKYIFPGIAGPDVINATHWLGALVSNVRTIGVKDTAVRRVIHRAAKLVPKPITCIALVVRGDALHGIWCGDYEEAWSVAADLSAELEIVHVPRGFGRVLSMPSEIYDDLWTAAKAMYKVEPAVADGGEVVIYAPHLREISFTHGRIIDQVGYHVLEYFTKQPERFAAVPGMIKAHSTHVKGGGSYDLDSGAERPRIRVTLATGISEERCRRVNLGYLDPRTVEVGAWEGREAEGVLVVRNAGEMLYRARDVS